MEGVNNFESLSKRFHRGLRICCQGVKLLSRQDLCKYFSTCKIEIRRDVHLFLFMHEQLSKKELLKEN